MYDFLVKHPTLPVIGVSAVVAFLSWLSQRRLTRAKHSIDLQNNYMSSMQMLKDLYQVGEWTRSMSSEEVARLAGINIATLICEEDRDKLACLRNALNCLERMSIGIQRKVYDEHLLFNSYASFVIEVWGTFGPYIRAKQVRNPHYYKNFQSLALEWVSKRDAITRRA